MKHKLLFIPLAIISLFIMSTSVSAKENQVYINENQVYMNQNQIDNLKSLKFTDEQIYKMTQEEFDLNKNLHGEIKSVDIKYYKTTYIPKPFSTFSLDEEDKYIILNEEVTEEEYLGLNIQPLANCGIGDSCWETEYKRLETSIIQVGTQYRFRSDLSWKQPPATRSNDVFAIAFVPVNISPVASSKYARYDWHMTRYDEETGSWYDDFGGTTYNSSHSNWRPDIGGYSLVIKLKPDEISSDGEHIDQVWNQSAYMYYNVAKSTNVTINILDAYGSYQHAQSTVNISSLASIILNPSAYNIIQFADSGIASKYDNMRKTHAQLTGLNW